MPWSQIQRVILEEAFRGGLQLVTGQEVEGECGQNQIRKWLDDLSTPTEYIFLNMNGDESGTDRRTNE
jgi:hypothetical protein